MDKKRGRSTTLLYPNFPFITAKTIMINIFSITIVTVILFTKFVYHFHHYRHHLHHFHHPHHRWLSEPLRIEVPVSAEDNEARVKKAIYLFLFFVIYGSPTICVYGALFRISLILYYWDVSLLSFCCGFTRLLTSFTVSLSVCLSLPPSHRFFF